MTTRPKAVVLRSQFSPPPPAPRVPVVIVVEPDGFLRAFAPDQVDVRFVGILDAQTADGRTAAEDYAKFHLPVPHKEIAFDARFSRGVFHPVPVTAEEELDRVVALSLVKGCRR